MQSAGGISSARFAILFLLATVAAVVAIYFWVKPEYENKAKLDQQRDELALRVQRERAEVDEINSKIMRFESDPEFVEHEARKNHRIFPGETEFIFDAPE